MVKDLQQVHSRGLHDRLGLTVKGSFVVERKDPAGRVLDRRVVRNTIVSAGQALLASFLAVGTAAGSTLWKALYIGTDTTAPITNDTNLGARTGVGVAGSLSSPSARVWQITAAFASSNPAGTAAISEAGVFDAVTTSGFTMWARQTFSVINKGASDNLNLTYSVTFNAG
jgi:hypothetical protein